MIPQPATHGVNVYDPEQEPAPVQCSTCGQANRWTWYAVPAHVAHLMRSRWLPPPNEKCETCHAAADDRKRRWDFEHRQQRAGIPERDRWARRNMWVDQYAGESIGDFRARLVALPHPRIGVTEANRAALRGLYKFKPGDGSAYLEGGVGTGKTLLACAVANDLLAQEHAFVPTTDATGHRRVKITGGWSVLFLSEDELVQKLRMKERDREGTAMDIATVASGVDLLILDDIGSVTSPPQYIRDMLVAVIDRRYGMHRRSMLVTSNIALDKLAESYGARAVSRLAEMVGPRRYTMTGEGWRSVAAARTDRAT